MDYEILQTITNYDVMTPMELKTSDGKWSRRVEGVQGLIQRFVLLFLTPYNEAKDTGTMFARHLAQGSITTRAAIPGLFAVASRDVIAQVNEAGGPLQEQLSKVTLTKYAIVRRSIELTIILTTKAGTDYTFVMPAR